MNQKGCDFFLFHAVVASVAGVVDNVVVVNAVFLRRCWIEMQKKLVAFMLSDVAFIAGDVGRCFLLD